MNAGFEERPPRGLPIVHGFLALLLSYHSGKVLPEIGHAVGDAIDRYYFGGERERDIGDIKKNPEEFAALVARELKENNIITDEEKAKQVILRGLPTIIRIAEKLWPENHDPDHLEKASDAFRKGVEDPIHILKQAGIDIEPELEEFRQFLAEISGKKIEPEKPKFPETKKVVFPELLAIAKALEYSAFSPEAMKRAEEDILRRLDKLLESPEENALEIAYTVKLLRLVQRGDVEGIKRFAK